LILVGVEDNDSFGLDGVVVVEFSVLSENLDGGVDVIEAEFNFVLFRGLGVVRLIEGDFEGDNMEEEEGDRERV
jgi:hypothetical protein